MFERDLPGDPDLVNNPLSIFIVEDEAIVADDLRTTLQGLGYAVAGVAHSAERAIEQVLSTRPGLVLMDIHLSGKLDGVDAAREIHKVCDVPIIYLTAYADRELLARAKLTQPYGYLIKPYDERELQSVIIMAGYKSIMDRKLKESEEKLRKLNEELEARVADRTATLREQVTFLQQLIDTIPAPVYYKDARGIYLGCNNAFLAYTGLARQDIIGKSDASFLSSDMAALSSEKDTQLISRRGIQVYQTKIPHADSTLRDVIIKKATFNNADGSIAGFIGVMIDISDRTRAEVSLQECEMRFEALAGDMAELVFRSSPDRTCLYANPAFLDLFSRAREETIGHVFMPGVHAEDAGRLQQHLASLAPEHPAGTVSFRVVLPGGDVRDLVWNVRAFFESSGSILEYQFIGCEHCHKKDPR